MSDHNFYCFEISQTHKPQIFSHWTSFAHSIEASFNRNSGGLILYQKWVYKVVKYLWEHFFLHWYFRTWLSDVATDNFCPGGGRECVNAKLAKCQDRTIQCLEQLPTPTGLIKKDMTSNETLNSHSLGAKFSYTCSIGGIFCNVLATVSY